MYYPTMLLGTSLLLLLAAHHSHGFSSVASTPSKASLDIKDRPLLKKFGQGIKKRIRHSKEGTNRHGRDGAYTSEETIPCLDMQGSNTCYDINKKFNINISSRRDVRKAFTESSRATNEHCNVRVGNQQHGRSSGSGCTIIRLTGEDAESIHGLTQYTNRFFDRVDDDNCSDSDRVKNKGVFRIDDHVYAGFDENVNEEGKMQFLDTRTLPSIKHDIDPLLLPMEVGELVGTKSLGDAHAGMNTLLDIGTQITSAVLGMDTESAEKLIDDGTHVQKQMNGENGVESSLAGDVSNSYHRLIRYLKPQSSGSNDAAFNAHVDSSFLTLIPMPKLPGLEIWCPSSTYDANCVAGEESISDSNRGEWVRPMIPFEVSMENNENNDSNNKDAYIIVMAGEFLQLTSNGDVPVCIHRVIPPRPPVVSANQIVGDYKPRVSAPMFLRPRRGIDANLDVDQDLKLVDNVPTSPDTDGSEDALYFEEGLLGECDGCHLWSVHGMMRRK